MSDFNQILTSLNLCTSDTRDDAMKSILKATLYENSSPLTIKEITTSIKEIYHFEPHEVEIKSTLEILDDLNEVTIVGDKYNLEKNEIIKLKEIEIVSKSEEEKRFKNLKQFLISNLGNSVAEEDIETIWEALLQYFYQCFFQYGEKASVFVNPKFFKNEEQKFNNTDILFSVLSDQNRLDLSEVLKFAIDNFSEFATSEDIDFIDSIGQKTLSFSSLGLDPKIAEDGFKSELIDWVLFLDTNFLFSILDLHANVEDEACKELLKLIHSNPGYIKVKLYYSDLTLRELKHKKADFSSIEEALTKPAIRALLRSDELDEFSKRYYESLLSNSDGTLHPSKIVDVADITLKARNIEVFSTGPQRKFLGEEFLNVKVAEYQTYINNLNEIRREYYQSKALGRPPREIFRSESQKEHDTALREIILLQRNSVKKKQSYKTLNQVKYFGVTLDELLIRFDNNEIKKRGEDEYPTFFKPSYLLNKFIKLLPVKTDNYKIAFIKAVSARGFYKDSKKSADVIKLVTYLKNQGIDNEDLLLNLITEKVFLEKYREESVKDDFNANNFIETEINRLYQEKEKALADTQKTLDEFKKEKEQDELQKNKLSDSKAHAEEQLKLYDVILEKLQTKVVTLESKLEKATPKPTINFEGEEQKKKNTELENQLKVEKIKRLTSENKIRKPKREAYIKGKLLRWQLWALVYFFVTVGILGLYIWFLYSRHSNDNVSFIESLKGNQTLQIILWVFGALLNIIFGKLVYDRFFNESFKKVYKENMDIPSSMKELRDINELD